MFGSKIFAEVKALGGLVGGLKSDFADFKATFAIAQRDIADLKNLLVEVKTLTGHPPAAPAAAPHIVIVPQSGLPLVTVPGEAVVQATSGGALITPTLQAELGADVAAVNPLGGVKLP